MFTAYRTMLARIFRRQKQLISTSGHNEHPTTAQRKTNCVHVWCVRIYLFNCCTCSEMRSSHDITVVTATSLTIPLYKPRGAQQSVSHRVQGWRVRPPEI